MSKIDQQFIEYIVKSLVIYPDDVRVDRIIDEKGVLLSLTVNQEDLGRIIGKRGVTAQSLRTLLRALGTKYDARYNLKIESDEQANDGSYEAPAVSSETVSEPAVAAFDSASQSNYSPFSEPVKNSTEAPVEKTYDYSKKTRAELAEFDDLDI